MIKDRAGVRKQEVPALKAAITGGSSPTVVARKFRLQYGVALNYFKLFKVDTKKFKDDLESISGEQIQSMLDKNQTLEQRVEQREKTIAELKAEIENLRRAGQDDAQQAEDKVVNAEKGGTK